MPTVIEIPANRMVAEHRHAFKPQSPSWEHVVASGEVDLDNASPEAIALQGHSDDETSYYEVHMIVGPWWRDVQVCVPHVVLSGFLNEDADEDDEQAWIARQVKWTTDGEGAPNPGEVRIRLEFTVGLRGEASWLRWISYNFTAAGRRLGVGGVKEPGPIKTGP